MYVRRFQGLTSGGVDSKKERLKDVRYQEFKEVGPDCDERLMLQLGPTSFLSVLI